MDVVFAFPAILLAIAIISLLGNNLTNAMIAIAIVYTPTFMRVVRGATLAVRHTAYVESAVSLGASTPRILAAHVFPNITAPLIVHASLNFAFAVLAEASLAFLGLGNKPPAPSWGSMVSASYGFLQLAPWAAIVPGVAIALAVLGFNLLGDGLRDALDPRSSGTVAGAGRQAESGASIAAVRPWAKVRASAMASCVVSALPWAMSCAACSLPSVSRTATSTS